MNFMLPSQFSSSSVVTVISGQKHAADPFDGFEAYADDGWDGNGANAIEASTLTSARRVYDFIQPFLRKVKKPNIAPGTDGTIGFEWYNRGSTIKKMFIEVQPGEQIRAYWVRPDGRIERNPIWTINFALYAIEPILTEMAGGGS
ncbi:MAG: hypothetical protein V4661_10860 [Pseudomonadota bacterium]